METKSFYSLSSELLQMVKTLSAYYYWLLIRVGAFDAWRHHQIRILTTRDDPNGLKIKMAAHECTLSFKCEQSDHIIFVWKIDFPADLRMTFVSIRHIQSSAGLEFVQSLKMNSQNKIRILLHKCFDWIYFDSKQIINLICPNFRYGELFIHQCGRDVNIMF